MRVAGFSTPSICERLLTEGFALTTLYAALGVEPDADAATIRRAYRELARRHHPDFGGDVRQMVSINEAWHVLGDPERRAGYNRQLRRPVPRPDARDGHRVMEWGQYEGWSLADIAKVDENYLRWLSRMPVGRPLQREIGELLAERSASEEAHRPAPIPRRRRWNLFSG
jgi:curved DNA-binding protein CbpA